VRLEVEAIDRMYLNVYVPHLQSVGSVVGYLRVHRKRDLDPIDLRASDDCDGVSFCG
jgi:hypothetical protein